MMEKERKSAMTDINNRSDRIEDDILTYEVSDEALEIAACVMDGKPAAFTIAMCSGLDSCPV